jgi:putative lipoic acid-binding regulatory protein
MIMIGSNNVSSFSYSNAVGFNIPKHPPLLHLWKGKEGDVAADDDDRLVGSTSDSSSVSDPSCSVDPMVPSTFRMDDGGSNLTDRFKYKVHALMGTFDPPLDGVNNHERQNGNLFHAMLSFPTKFTFYVVGKTLGEEEVQTMYVDTVKKLVYETTGDDDMTYHVTPRGKNFVKVIVQANVQSSTMITSIYDDLENLERTVMRF